MGYTALYRKFRPTTFSEIVGQEHITKTLKNQIINNRVGHAYLFTGGRGTGKTSSAKILARAINCLNPQNGEPCNECEICKEAMAGTLTDIVEMDAASNNGVDDIRNLREEVNFLPTKAKYRVYIIDEVHMLSTGAFNALLKTLEEPPEHVKFILATTEPQKLPATILSRCQRFDFKRISNEDIVKRLKVVCNESNISATDEALNIIATLSEGAMRDSLSILERCIQDGENKIDEDKVRDLVGIPKISFVNGISSAIIEYDINKALKETEEIINDGKDLNNLIWEIIKYIKDILIYKVAGKVDLYSEKGIDDIKDIAEKTDKERLVSLIYELSKLESDMKWSTQKTIVFEAGIIKLCSKDFNIEKPEITNSSNNKTQINNNIVSKKTIENKIENERPKQNTKEIFNTQPKTSTQSYSTNLEKSWPKVLNDLKQNGKIVLYTNLLNTQATLINEDTVEIKFLNGMTAFGKTILEKQENIKELTELLSRVCNKNVRIIYNSADTKGQNKSNPVNDIKQLANNADIPFNIID